MGPGDPSLCAIHAPQPQLRSDLNAPPKPRDLLTTGSPFLPYTPSACWDGRVARPFVRGADKRPLSPPRSCDSIETGVQDNDVLPGNHGVEVPATQRREERSHARFPWKLEVVRLHDDTRGPPQERC